MNKCSKCLKVKDVNSFHSDGRGGKRKICKECTLIQQRYYSESNKDSIKLKDKKYRYKNLDRLREYGRLHYKLNKEAYNNSSATRRALNKSAYPKWLSIKDKESIKNFYWLAKDISLTTGEPYDVDHIIPLNNETICGLHVPWNLQILPRSVNIAKRNSINCVAVCYERLRNRYTTTEGLQ